MRLAVVSLLCVCAPALLALNSEWTRLRSDHFEMLAGGDIVLARATLWDFEQAESFFESTLQFRPRADHPVRIIAFGLKHEFDRYAINNSATAYYLNGRTRDVIVMGEVSETASSMAMHEYFHLVARQSGWELPLWANEGLAELYSTVKQTGAQASVGAPPRGRLQQVQVGRWIALDRVLAASTDSEIYSEKNNASGYYGEAWALMHMLALSPKYRPQFAELFQALTHGADAAVEFQKLYGKSVGELDGELQKYVQHRHLPEELFDVPARHTAEIRDEAIAEDYDRRMALLELRLELNHAGDVEPALRDLDQLIALHPERKEAYVERAYRNSLKGNVEAAAKDYVKLYQLGSRDAELLWDVGRTAMSVNAAVASAALEELLRLQPARAEVTLQLAQLKANAGDASGALRLIAPLATLPPQQEAQLLDTQTYAQLKLERWAEAQRSAEVLKQKATTDEQRANAAHALDFLAHRGQAAAAAQRPIAIEDDEQSSVAPAASTRATERGTWVELQCPDSGPRLVLKTASGAVKRYLIDKPNRVQILNAGATPVDLSCGVKKPRAIVVQFDAAPAAAHVDGLLRAIRVESGTQPTSAKP